MSTKKRPHLLFCPAGPRSFHPRWLNERERNFDLWVLYYGNPADHVEGDRVFHLPGGYRFGMWGQVAEENLDEIWEYETIGLWDDDLWNTVPVSDVFELFTRTGVTLAQPALTTDSPHSWPVTLQHKDAVWRETNFIEIMCPLMKTSFFVEHTLNDLRHARTGWGMDTATWPLAIEKINGKIGILDATPVSHARPAYTNSGINATAKANQEWHELSQRHGTGWACGEIKTHKTHRNEKLLYGLKAYEGHFPDQSALLHSDQIGPSKSERILMHYGAEVIDQVESRKKICQNCNQYQSESFFSVKCSASHKKTIRLNQDHCKLRKW